MAVYTEVSDEELNDFLALYDIGDAVSFKGIAEGVENSNFLLRTTESQYILTLYEKRVKEAELPFFVGLMEHLAERGVTCPQPVRKRAGEALGELAGRPGGDRHLPRRNVDTAAQGRVIAAEVGRALGAHAPGWRRFRDEARQALSIAGWPPLFRAAEARANGVGPRLREESATELAFLRRTGRPACRAASSTPISSTTTCFSSARSCRVSSTSTSPATMHWPTIWRSV